MSMESPTKQPILCNVSGMQTGSIIKCSTEIHQEISRTGIFSGQLWLSASSNKGYKKLFNTTLLQDESNLAIFPPHVLQKAV